MSIDMDRTCRVYFFIYDPDSGGEAVRQDTRCFNSFKPILVHTGSVRIQDVLLIKTDSDWFKLVRARCMMFYSFKPIQTSSNWFRQDARCFTLTRLFRTGSNWFNY
jgi:hypothetical protein